MNLQREHERYARDPSGKKTSGESAKEPRVSIKAFADCPICSREGPHNHSALTVEAFHRANENEARSYGLVTFSLEEIRSLTKRRAKGINDRAEPRL